MSLITQLAGSLVALVFGWGAIAKLVRFSQWQQALGAYRLPPLVARAASTLVPLAEIAVTGLFVTDHALAGAALTVALLAGFSLALLSAHRSQGNRLPCGCFGRATPHDYRLLVGRNGALACLAGVVLIDGRDRLFTDAMRPTSTTLLPAALVVLGLSMALWMGREVTEAMRKR
jgi:Methylamine utilisation protein MauE